jgi:hypothetical protein
MGLINRAFREYERRSFGKLKGAERDRAKNGFYAGVLVTLRMLSGVESAVEEQLIWRALADELREHGESLPCTCGKCHEHERRGRSGERKNPR